MTKTFDNVAKAAENRYCYCCCVVCAIILFSVLQITKKCTANERTNDWTLVGFVLHFCTGHTKMRIYVMVLYERFVSDCFLFSSFFLLRLFSSSLRPTFWCHFRISIVQATDRTIDIVGTIFYLRPKIANCIRTHTQTYSEFLGIICHFFPFQHFLYHSVECPEQFHEKYFNSINSFALLQRAFNKFC